MSGSGDEIDPIALYGADARSSQGDGRPWLLVNMISSVDGATAVSGRSGALGSPVDKQVFAAIRQVADVILVAAGTVRSEHYGPPETGARLAVVSASLDLDPGARLFADAKPARRPWLVTTASADASKLAPVVDDIIVTGDERVDVTRAVDELAARGARVVLCEGGPSLNGQLIAAGLVDELCLTVAPLLVAGDSSRIAHGDPAPSPFGMRLDRAVEHDGYLFLRYVKVSGVSAQSLS